MKNRTFSAGFALLPVLLVILALVVVGGGAYTYYNAKQIAAPQSVACTQEAKQCPDGSYVGRTGPNCEFSACPQTQAITNTAAPTASAASISVPGMSQYTDKDFGFSFWYPSGWTLKEMSQTENGARLLDGEVVLKAFSMSEGAPVYNEPGDQSNLIRVFEISSSNKSISSYGTGKSSDERYFFDTTTHTWMTHASYQDSATTTADVSRNTMGGLHMFYGGGWPQASDIIPLSATKFVVLDVEFDSFKLDTLAKTLVATDPSVATPVSAAQQTATIQAEMAAYAGQ